MSDPEEPQPEDHLRGKRVTFVGKLGGVTKREAQKVVRDHGGIPLDQVSTHVDLIVVGADELPLGEEHLLSDSIYQASAESRLEIISETQFWQQLGWFQEEATQLYTPAMLAELLDVPVAIVRRWHRRKLIVPVREVRRLPYFDFQEVSTARQLAQLLAAGASPSEIERKLAELSRYVPDVDRPLAQLSVIIQGKQLLLRQGEGLIEPGGQLRIDFEAFDDPTTAENLSFDQAALSIEESFESSPTELIQMAAAMEENGQLEQAAELYRAAMAASGPQPEICFELAEVLYRLGDLGAARERYFTAIELDEDYVEARANLGCVLAETGKQELAVAAFQGALSYHRDFPDVHYHLARLLDEMQRHEEAEQHWAEFLLLAPDSPWSEEARERINHCNP